MEILTLMKMRMITTMMTIMVIFPVITMSYVVSELSSAKKALLTE